MNPDQQFADYLAQIVNRATVPVSEIPNVQQSLLWLQQIAEGKATILRPQPVAEVDDEGPDSVADEAVGD